MKVILLKDVPKLGQHGEVKDVADGFALNSLLPRGLAEIATPEKVAALKKNQAAKASAEEAKLEEWKKAVISLKEKLLKIIVKTNEQGHLYEQITAKNIAEAFKKHTSVDIPESAFLIDTPIKEIGEHKVEVKVGSEKVSTAVTIEAN